MTCKDCIHDGVCHVQEMSTGLELEEYIRELDCEDYISNTEMAEWIDVNERLPEEDTRVLVVLSQEAAMTYTKMDTDRINDGKWVRWHNRITHWMPLPEPPKVGVNDG